MSAEPIRALTSEVTAILVLLTGAGLDDPKAAVAVMSGSRVGRCMVLSTSMNMLMKAPL
jgi:hypothetical protein